MKVRVFVGLVDPDSDPAPFGFSIGRGIPVRENCEFPWQPNLVPAGQELSFKVWLKDRGVPTECDPDGPQRINVDVPDHLVFELINAWSVPR